MQRLITIAAVFTFARGSEFSCFNGPPDGLYCTNDRIGYHDCRLDSNHQPQNLKKYCPRGTRCSCFINTKCEVTESEICQPLPVPPLFSEDFDITFSFQRKESSPVGFRRVDQIARVIRNNGLKKIAERIWFVHPFKRQYFRVITRFGSKFLSYSGIYPPENAPALHRCQTSVIDKFPEFWPDLKQFQLVQKVGNIETWMYKIGARNLGETARGTTWKLQVDGDRVTPLQYEAFQIGSIGSKFSFNEIGKTRIFYPLKPSPAYFQIPGFCFSTKKV